MSTVLLKDRDLAKLWCYCNEPSFGEMIMCNNEKCLIRWFHFDCLRIRGSGIVHLVGNFQNLIITELLFHLIFVNSETKNIYSCATIEGHKFTHAQHTFTILSMVDLVSLLS